MPRKPKQNPKQKRVALAEIDVNQESSKRSRKLTKPVQSHKSSIKIGKPQLRNKKQAVYQDIRSTSTSLTILDRVDQLTSPPLPPISSVISVNETLDMDISSQDKSLTPLIRYNEINPNKKLINLGHSADYHTWSKTLVESVREMKMEPYLVVPKTFKERKIFFEQLSYNDLVCLSNTNGGSASLI